MAPASAGAPAGRSCGHRRHRTRHGTLAVLLATEGYAVTGLDFAPAMIRAARAKARRADVKSRFVLSDAAEPTLPSGSFDVVLARHVLWAMPNPGQALAAWLRLLLPDGVLILAEGRFPAGSGLKSAESGRMVLRQRADATIISLSDPALWGRPVTDQRYLLISRR